MGEKRDRGRKEGGGGLERMIVVHGEVRGGR